MNLPGLLKGLWIAGFLALSVGAPTTGFAQWRNVGPIENVKGIIPADSCQFRAKIISYSDDISFRSYDVGYLDLQPESDQVSRISATQARRQLFLSGSLAGKLALPFRALLSPYDQAAASQQFTAKPESDGRILNYKLAFFFEDILNVAPKGPLLLNASLASRQVSGKIAVERANPGDWVTFSTYNLATHLNLSKVQLQVNCGPSIASGASTTTN